MMRAKSSSLTDVAVCKLATSQALAIDSYKGSRTLGGFILVDRQTHATVAAGIIHHSLRRAQNVHRQKLTVTRSEREFKTATRAK